MTYEDIDITTRREYKGVIAIEQLTAAQINRIMEYGSKKLRENYEEAIELLVDLLPPDLEQRAIEYKKEHQVSYDMSLDGEMRYRGLFRHIKRLLSEGNIVWKKTSFEIGTES
jgi:hypothetical protein